MSIFSRFSDIISSNIGNLVERSADPERTIRLIIKEMEDTLVEVRSTSAHTIAEKKELERRIRQCREMAADWQAKAELALRKQREDLARAALMEQARAEDQAESLAGRLGGYDDVLDKLSAEIRQLQDKLDDARARQAALSVRQSGAGSRWKVRRQMDNEQQSRPHFDAYEREVDAMEAGLEAHDLGRRRTLADEIEELAANERIDSRLAALKRSLGDAPAATPERKDADFRTDFKTQEPGDSK